MANSEDFKGRYLEGTIKDLNPENDKQLYQRLFCWQQVLKFQDKRYSYKSDLKAKILNKEIYEPYFSHIDRKLDIKTYLEQPTDNEYLSRDIVEIKSKNDNKNWITLSIEKERDLHDTSKFEYQNKSFKVTYCIDGEKLEEFPFFNLIRKNHVLYVYLTKDIPKEYRTCLTVNVDHKNIYREVERRTKSGKRKGETITYQSYRSMVIAERYKLEKSRKKKSFYLYDINLRGFLKYFVPKNDLNKIDSVIERISKQLVYSPTEEKIGSDVFQFVDFPFLINYQQIKTVFPTHLVATTMKEISQEVFPTIDKLDDIDLKHMTTSRFYESIFSGYLHSGHDDANKPISKIKKENEKLFDCLLNYSKNTLDYIHKTRPKLNKNLNQTNILDSSYERIKTIKIM